MKDCGGCNVYQYFRQSVPGGGQFEKENSAWNGSSWMEC